MSVASMVIGASPRGFGYRTQRLDEARFAEYGRVQPVCNVSQFVQCLVDADADPVQPVSYQGVCRGGLARERKLDLDRDQTLLHAVVKVSLDPPAFGVACSHEPRARFA